MPFAPRSPSDNCSAEPELACRDVGCREQKLEAVGGLAGGIAHVFNNLMAIVVLNAELLAERLREDPEALADAQAILAAGWQAAEAARNLLAFSRQQPIHPGRVDLNDVVTAVCGMRRVVIDEHVELVVELADGLWPTLADHAQMERVLINLCTNACAAMPTAGTLTLSTANQTIDEEAEGHASVPSGDYVVLSVRDSGEGIEEPHRSRVFEPFFTTKNAGDGLGLSICHGIVKQSDGDIFLTDGPLGGTTFEVWMPRLRAAECTRAQQSPLPEALPNPGWLRKDSARPRADGASDRPPVQ